MLGYLPVVLLVLTALSPFVVSEVFADSFTVNYDEKEYDFGDTLTISGQILDFGMPVIGMSIYDPDGVILSANSLEISENTFSKSITLDSTFYEKTGEYKMKFDYAQTTQNYYFIIAGKSTGPEIPVEVFEEIKITLLDSDKEQYTDGDTINILGTVSKLDSPTVLIGIYDPFGMPMGFYFGTVDSNLEFSTSFLVKAGVNFRADGKYSIKAHYAETETIAFFDFYKYLPPEIQNDVENNIETKDQDSSSSEETKDNSTDVSVPDVSDDSSSENVIDDSSYDEDIPLADKVPITENSQIEKIKTTTKDTVKKTNPIDDAKKQTNLSVEDIELGQLLNQINLECDSSTLTDTISYYDGMGPALYRLCKFDSSLNFFNESLIDNSTNVEILTNKGSALGKLGYFSEAIVYYDYAIDIDPDFLYAKNNKANALVNLNQFDAAISLYREVLMENPDYVTAQKNLEIALSLSISSDDIIEKPESVTNQVDSQESYLNENSDPEKRENQKPTNFFEEVGNVFSSFSSVFDFLN